MAPERNRSVRVADILDVDLLPGSGCHPGEDRGDRIARNVVEQVEDNDSRAR